MAVGSAADFAIQNDFRHTGMVESIAQNIMAFNAASRGALTLSAAQIIGRKFSSTFHKRDLAARARDPEDTTTPVAAEKLTGDEIVSVKVDRGIGPYQYTRDSFVKQYGGGDIAVANRVLGAQAGEEMVKDALNQGINGSVAALIARSMQSDISGGATLTFSAINTARALMGDRLGELVALVLHSKAFIDLEADGLANYKIDTVAGARIVSGSSLEAMGLVLVVTDSTYLTATTPDRYHSLMLQPGAIDLVMTEQTQSDVEVHGFNNIHRSYQVDFAYNLTLRGQKWTGANSPDEAALGTGGNWTQAATSTKDLGGVVITSD